jgi:hypothetical protein
MPHGRHEYWVTELIFKVGDKLERFGATWIVTSVGETDEMTGKHMTVTVRRADEPSSGEIDRT